MEYSVLMSVYASEKGQYLQESVNSMLQQTCPPGEFVLVCDGPLTQELNDVIKGYEQKYPSLFRIVRIAQNVGLGEALETGRKVCKYDLIARMDSDDIALPERMEIELKALEKNPDVSVVGGQILEFFDVLDNKGKCRLVPQTPDEIRATVSRRNPMNHMTVVFRREALAKAGGYMSCGKFEDYFLWARILQKEMKMLNVPEVVVYARINNNMFHRRGGIGYFKDTVKLEQYLRDNGICTNFQYVTNIIIRFLGTVMLPNTVRKKAYALFLRK